MTWRRKSDGRRTHHRRTLGATVRGFPRLGLTSCLDGSGSVTRGMDQTQPSVQSSVTVNSSGDRLRKRPGSREDLRDRMSLEVASTRDSQERPEINLLQPMSGALQT